MVAKGYTDTQKVADYLGRTLTAAQSDQAESLIEKAEAYIDGHTGRSWLLEPITGERHDLTQGAALASTPLYPPRRVTVQLDHYPVDSVEAITGHRLFSSATPTTLVAGTDFEVDTESGEIILRPGCPYSYLLVDYTPHQAAFAPAAVELAATIFVAAYLLPTLDSDALPGVSSWSIGKGDLSVKYSEPQQVMGKVNEVLDAVYGSAAGPVIF